METSDTLDANFSNNFEITGEIKSYLKETAKWANFIAIVGFILLVLLVLVGIGASYFLSTLGDQFGGQSFGGQVGFIGLFYIVMAVIYFFPILYLYRFAQKMKSALKSNNQEVLTSSFEYLKSHYKFIGIMMAIIFGIYVLFFLGAILFGGLASMF